MQQATYGNPDPISTLHFDANGKITIPTSTPRPQRYAPNGAVDAVQLILAQMALLPPDERRRQEDARRVAVEAMRREPSVAEVVASVMRQKIVPLSTPAYRVCPRRSLHPVHQSGKWFSHALHDGEIVEVFTESLDDMKSFMREQGFVDPAARTFKAERKTHSDEKISSTALNSAHNAYLANGLELEPGQPEPETITLEEYTDVILDYLSADNSQEDVIAFVASNADKLEAGTFCPPSSRKFNKKLLQAWHAYQRDNLLLDDQQEPVGPLEQQQELSDGESSCSYFPASHSG
jgi:hypothetical protein